MRTTIVLDDMFSDKIKRLAPKRKVSDFINQCLREHFEREENESRMRLLEKAYSRAARISTADSSFDDIAIEGWPEW